MRFLFLFFGCVGVWQRVFVSQCGFVWMLGFVGVSVSVGVGLEVRDNGSWPPLVNGICTRALYLEMVVGWFRLHGTLLNPIRGS